MEQIVINEKNAARHLVQYKPDSSTAVDDRWIGDRWNVVAFYTQKFHYNALIFDKMANQQTPKHLPEVFCLHSHIHLFIELDGKMHKFFYLVHVYLKRQPISIKQGAASYSAIGLIYKINQAMLRFHNRIVDNNFVQF